MSSLILPNSLGAVLPSVYKRIFLFEVRDYSFIFIFCLRVLDLVSEYWFMGYRLLRTDLLMEDFYYLISYSYFLFRRFTFIFSFEIKLILEFLLSILPIGFSTLVSRLQKNIFILCAKSSALADSFYARAGCR